jgi:hypothetical protein
MLLKCTKGNTTKDVLEQISRLEQQQDLSSDQKKKLAVLKEMSKLQKERNKLMTEASRAEAKVKKAKRGEKFTPKVNWDATRKKRWDITNKIRKMNIKLGVFPKGSDEYSSFVESNRTKSLKPKAEKESKIKKDLKKSKKDKKKKKK